MKISVYTFNFSTTIFVDGTEDTREISVEYTELSGTALRKNGQGEASFTRNFSTLLETDLIINISIIDIAGNTADFILPNYPNETYVIHKDTFVDDFEIRGQDDDVVDNDNLINYSVTVEPIPQDFADLNFRINSDSRQRIYNRDSSDNINLLYFAENGPIRVMVNMTDIAGEFTLKNPDNYQ